MYRYVQFIYRLQIQFANIIENLFNFREASENASDNMTWNNSWRFVDTEFYLFISATVIWYQWSTGFKF